MSNVHKMRFTTLTEFQHGWNAAIQAVIETIRRNPNLNDDEIVYIVNGLKETSK